jgi:DNA-binding NarL/FixJ family response regulator
MLETELQNKNNELTLQTSALVKRNQSIQTLLEELEQQKEALGTRYPTKFYTRMRTLMEETLNDQADWLQFESYFSSAHQNFIERLRQQYSDLTTGDFRICCLLRMNLSTKEIASLMNISVRAVELRRYRLRKRMMLDGDTNLVDFLMNL